MTNTVGFDTLSTVKSCRSFHPTEALSRQRRFNGSTELVCANSHVFSSTQVYGNPRQPDSSAVFTVLRTVLKIVLSLRRPAKSEIHCFSWKTAWPVIRKVFCGQRTWDRKIQYKNGQSHAL